MVEPALIFACAKLGSAYWEATRNLRWFRPSGCTDGEMVLQQCWVSNLGAIEWRELPTVLAD